jgi:hypothetical protein
MKRTIQYSILVFLILCSKVTSYSNNTFGNTRFHAQLDTTPSNFSFMEKINDSTFTADFENDMLMRVKINGSIIHPDEISKYQKFVDKAQEQYDATKAESPFYSQNSMDVNKMPNNLDVWEKTFIETLKVDGLISLKKRYKIEFGDLALRIDGKNVSKQVYEKYLKQYKDITGVALSMAFTLKDE